MLPKARSESQGMSMLCVNGDFLGGSALAVKTQVRMSTDYSERQQIERERADYNESRDNTVIMLSCREWQ
jgi:hypothetical protein